MSFNRKTDNNIGRQLPEIKKFLEMNYGLQINGRELNKAILQYVELEFERVVDDLTYAATTPGSDDHTRFMSVVNKGTIFTGNREFSLKKLQAILVYFFVKLGAKQITKTKLNKLAFYSDFYKYRDKGTSISGSRYKHLPYGPVISDYDRILEDMERSAVIGFGSTENIDSKKIDELLDCLTEDDLEVLDTISTSYGKLSATELTNLSHEEMAYKNTETGEFISYGFAEYIK